MNPYVPPPAPPGALRLHLNEHTGGCSPRVLDAIRAVTAQQAACYPDYRDATAACAAHLGVRPEQLMLTNGLDEGILAAALAGLAATPAREARPESRERPIRDAVVLEPAFEMYAATVYAAGGRLISIPAGDKLALQPDRVLDAIGSSTRVVFLNTPHNPTGQLIEAAAIGRIADAAPDAIVFVDEAYTEFAGSSWIDCPDQRRNVVVGRTFSKAYGLAGIRIGCLIGAPETIDPLREIALPFGVNVCAVAALHAALADQAYVRGYLDEVAESKRLIYDACERFGFEFWRSHANFVLIRAGADASRVAAGLAARGIAIRDRSRDAGLTGCIRISAGVTAHTRACLAIMEEILCAAR